MTTPQYNQSKTNKYTYFIKTESINLIHMNHIIKQIKSYYNIEGHTSIYT